MPDKTLLQANSLRADQIFQLSALYRPVCDAGGEVVPGRGLLISPTTSTPEIFWLIAF